MIEVRVPDLGDFADVPVIEILVDVGQEVAAEDPLITLESDKATMEIPAPEAGVVREILVKLGHRVSAGTVFLALDPAVGPAVAPDAPRQAPDSDTQDSQAPASAAADHDAATSTPQHGRDAQVVVIGAGPGGYTAAFRAADLGLKTLLVEREARLGGVCLNVGCIPSKALLHIARVIAEAEDAGAAGVRFGSPEVDLDALRTWKDAVVDRLTGGLASLASQRKVEVCHGQARFTGPNTIDVDGTEISFEHCIIAAGSSPARLPFLPADERILDSTAALEIAAVPERLLVVGGGIIGLEMAGVYHALGARVTVVELMDHLLPGADADLVKPLQQRISERYEAVHVGASVAAVEAADAGLNVTFTGGPPADTFNAMLVAVGRRPNGAELDAERAGVQVDERGFIAVDSQLRTNIAHIHAIGDIVGEPLLAHKAMHEGKIAAEVIAGHDVSFDARTIPSVAYTDPEVAWMGLTETAAQADGIEVETARFPWAASGRALTLARPQGSTKLVLQPDTGRVLGAGVVGVGAGELIAELTLALEMDADAQDIALTVHPHPTLSETVGLAAESAIGTITDLYLPARRRTRS